MSQLEFVLHGMKLWEPFAVIRCLAEALHAERLDAIARPATPTVIRKEVCGGADGSHA